MNGAVLGLIGITVALGVPLLVEWSRRPKLRIDRADDVNGREADPPWRMVHIKVVNLPLRGWRSWWLLRNPATSCRVKLTFQSQSDGSKVEMAGRWSASPEPVSLVALPPTVSIDYALIDPNAGVPDMQWHFDATKVPQTLRLDLSADDDGETVPVAIKFRDESAAFGFTSESYAPPDARKSELRLADEEYLVTVDAVAGGIKQRRQFRLHNAGQYETDLRLEPLD